MFRKAYSTALVCPAAVAGNTSGLGNRLAVEPGMPVPLSATACGAPVAALWIVNVAKKGPGAVGGVNVTLTKQNVPGVITPEQLLVAWNAFGLAPLSGVVNVKFVLPVFCKKTDCAALVVPAVCLPNCNEVGKMVASVAAAFNPVPVRETDCGESGSLSETVNCPPIAPADVGENTMLNVQLCPGASPAPIGQVVPEIVKAPLIDGEMLDRVGPPGLDTFISVTVIAPLVVFTT